MRNEEWWGKSLRDFFYFLGLRVDLVMLESRACSSLQSWMMLLYYASVK